MQWQAIIPAPTYLLDEQLPQSAETAAHNSFVGTLNTVVAVQARHPAWRTATKSQQVEVGCLHRHNVWMGRQK